MTEADYYREQANACRRDATESASEAARRQLRQLAQHYEVQARWADAPRTPASFSTR